MKLLISTAERPVEGYSARSPAVVHGAALSSLGRSLLWRGGGGGSGGGGGGRGGGGGCGECGGSGSGGMRGGGGGAEVQVDALVQSLSALRPDADLQLALQTTWVAGHVGRHERDGSGGGRSWGGGRRRWRSGGGDGGGDGGGGGGGWANREERMRRIGAARKRSREPRDGTARERAREPRESRVEGRMARLDHGHGRSDHVQPSQSKLNPWQQCVVPR